ncbi:MAG: DUF3090 domain-containing protein [Actinomycetota bacterium]
MSDEYELEEVDRVTFGALGPPGRRTFYLQARKGPQLLTLVVEKDHVIAMEEATEEIFKSAGYPQQSTDWDPDSLVLEQPLEPAFRVGTMAIGYDEDRDLVLIECRAVADESDIGPSARLWITRVQLEALSSHGMVVAAQGRPLCPLCRVPMDPSGHTCYATNGHRTDA